MEIKYSSLSFDPEFREILKQFVSEIPARIAQLRQALEDENLDRLKTLVHQLKGACGGYGFSEASFQAQSLETRIANLSSGDDLTPDIEAFVAMLERLTAATP
ncbi:MAG: Hpt domain-containing protein [Pirellula sp.]